VLRCRADGRADRDTNSDAEAELCPAHLSTPMLQVIPSYEDSKRLHIGITIQ